jgi:hypothetical protein
LLPAESFLCSRRIPQITLEIEDGGVADQGLVDIGGSQILAGAEEGVHRALAIGCHQHVASGGRGPFGRGCRIEMHADGADIMREGPARFVAFHLADEGGSGPERCQTHDRIGC